MGPVSIQNVMQDVHMIQHGTCALGHAVQRVLSHMHVDAGLALAVSVWLQKQKNQKILSRLSYDSISIKEIAHEFGFLSASSFNKYCKCNFGYNPTELKKQIKERRIESSVFQRIK